MRRIGILGGTFDPPHLGHLWVAEGAVELLGLDRVFFVPNRSPVHRSDVVANAEDRYAMVLLATADNPAFRVSREELDREGPSYSVDTVAAFRRRYPHAELFFIAGADEAADLSTWKDVDRLLSMCRFVAAPRQGAEADAKAHPRVEVLPMDPIAVSATDVRARLESGRSVRYRVPDAVARYIDSHGLYRKPGNGQHT
jgi:nicotinate-nucleotide adenylyltransferase